MDVFEARAGRLLVVLDDGLALPAEALLERAVEVLDGEVRDGARRAERDDVAHDCAARLLGERFEGDVQPDHSLGDFDVRHGGAVAVVDDDGALVQFVEVLVDCSLCERDEHVESVDDALHGVDGSPNLVRGVSAPDSRSEILRREHVASGPGECLSENLPRGVDAIASLAADGPVEVRRHAG